MRFWQDYGRGGIAVIYAYIIPLFFLLCFFLAIVFLVEWLAKFILVAFLLLIVFLPFLLIYKEEVRDVDPVTQKEKK
ncbi:phage holin family protein [Halobacillus sp. A5]|uniref:phage holin family protein n=1 Tax=Halobacillus sp. A5 TaxID=2880263 RepID=UPI002113669C|nr:phage holin family protein [Halobacillus sp. A5]MCP3026829.1 phage holin family protein [Halobacillus sp. A5]